MAGLYDRVAIDAGISRISGHLIVGSVKAVAGDIYSETQVINAVEQWLSDRGLPALRPEDITDLQAIIAEAEEGTKDLRIEYAVARLEAAFIGAESGVLPEAQWRLVLRI